MQVQKFGGGRPRKKWGAKTCKISGFSTLIANISGTDQHIELGTSEKKLDQPQPLPRWMKETWWTLVHKQKSSRGAYWATHVDIFRETTYISAIRRCCPLKFLYTLQLFLEGSPQKIWERQKTSNFGAISDNFRLLSRISPERIVISNIWKKLDQLQLQPLPRWTKKFGELWSTTKKFWGAYWPTLSALSV